MGRSRRERAVALTKTRKHTIGRNGKQEVVSDLRNQLDSYARLYVFSTTNIRNAALKELRSLWKDSKWHFGRRRVMQIALGRSPEEEYLDGLHRVSEWLRGDVGLLLTNRSHEDVSAFFKTFSRDDFARSGFVATETVVLPAGVVEHFQQSHMANLQLLGLPVEMDKGSVVLPSDFTVCEEGDVLTPERAKILEQFGIRLATFSVTLNVHYQKDGPKFEVLNSDALSD